MLFKPETDFSQMQCVAGSEIPEVARRPATITDWIYRLLACNRIGGLSARRRHHPKCARPKEFLITIRVIGADLPIFHALPTCLTK
jgi:hypothetical protein